MIKSYTETLRELFSSPRNVIDAFLHESGSRFLHPFKFLLIGLFVILLINTLLVDFSVETSAGDLGIDSDDEQIQLIAEWIHVSNIRASTQFLPLSMMALFIPMLALGGLIFLRNETDGFYHNLILNSYAVGAAMTVLLLLIPLWIFLPVPLSDPWMHSTMPAVLIAGIIIWIYNSYLHPDGVMDWIRLISAYATGYILFVILNGFMAGVVGYVIFVIQRIGELAG